MATKGSTAREFTSARLIELIGEGDAVDYATLLQRAGVPARTLERRLSDLIDGGILFRWTRGVYGRRPLDEPEMGFEGGELLMLLRCSEADAHLTGFDVLARYAHQFAYGYTHLVYCHPSHISGLTHELSGEDWVLLPAGHHVRLGGPRSHRDRAWADSRRTPVSGEQSSRAAREGLGGSAARGASKSSRIRLRRAWTYLRSMERAGVPIAKLRTYARNAGYLPWVEAAFGVRAPASIEQAQLAAGYAS